MCVAEKRYLHRPTGEYRIVKCQFSKDHHMWKWHFYWDEHYCYMWSNAGESVETAEAANMFRPPKTNKSVPHLNV